MGMQGFNPFKEKLSYGGDVLIRGTRVAAVFPTHVYGVCYTSDEIRSNKDEFGRRRRNSTYVPGYSNLHVNTAR